MTDQSQQFRKAGIVFGVALAFLGLGLSRAPAAEIVAGNIVVSIDRSTGDWADLATGRTLSEVKIVKREAGSQTLEFGEIHRTQPLKDETPFFLAGPKLYFIRNDLKITRQDFVPEDEPALFSLLTLRNQTDKPRKLTVQFSGSVNIRPSYESRLPNGQDVVSYRDGPVNGPSVCGVWPGTPFFHAIPATGKRPMEFSAKGLPPGLAVDTVTGFITGTIEKPGEHIATLRVRNESGSVERPLRVVCGEKLALTPPMGWMSRDLGAFNGEFKTQVEPHEVVVVRLVPEQKNP